MRGGSLRRYVPPPAGGNQTGNGLGELVVPAKDIVRQAWQASVDSLGGPKV